jgi:hypothetical protein
MSFSKYVEINTSRQVMLSASVLANQDMGKPPRTQRALRSAMLGCSMKISDA